MRFGVTHRCGPCSHAEPARQGLAPRAMQDTLRSQSGAAGDIWWKDLGLGAQIRAMEMPPFSWIRPLWLSCMAAMPRKPFPAALGLALSHSQVFSYVLK